MNEPTLLRPALIAGVALGVLSALPVVGAVNCLCCAWVIAGGIFAAYLHVHASPIAVTLGRGVLLGLLTGAVGAVVDTLFSIPLQLALAGAAPGVAGRVSSALEHVPNLPPELRDAVLSALSDEKGLGLFFIFVGGVVKLVAYSIVCMLGAAVGVAVFEKRPPGTDSRVPPPAYQPPADLPPPPPPVPDNRDI